MKNFMDRDFLLETETAKKLYHDYAEQMPIIDYRCQIPAEDIAKNVRFENVTGVVTADVPVEMRSVSDIDFRGFNVTSGPGLRSTPGENTGDSWERDP